MARSICFLVGLTLGCALLVGCGEPRPEGMPTLYPCEITVMDGDGAFDNAGLSLSPVEGTWSATGQTNEMGVAKIVTQGKYEGAAAGKYRVSLSKRSPDIGLSDEEIRKLPPEEAKKATNERVPGESLVPDYLSIAKLSPIEIEVTADGENKVTINLQDYAEPTDEYKAQMDAHEAQVSDEGH